MDLRQGQRIRRPDSSEQALAVYTSVIQGAPNSAQAAAWLHTAYKAAQDPAVINPLGVQW